MPRLSENAHRSRLGSESGAPPHLLFAFACFSVDRVDTNQSLEDWCRMQIVHNLYRSSAGIEQNGAGNGLY
jgi:hypothetical protein